eukprot:7695206-Ditylum_brightwellii.AAC.2
MEMAEFLKNEEPADDDVEAHILKGLLWNSMSSKDIQSQVIDTAMLGSVPMASENLQFPLLQEIL